MRIPIEIKHDAVTKLTSYTRPNCAEHPADHIVLIQPWAPPDAEVTYQLYVSDTYTEERRLDGIGWRSYDRAQDLDRTILPTEVRSRNVNWCAKNVCQYFEAVWVAITRPYLQDRIRRGITLKISGTGGEAIAKVPAAYVQAFLQQVPEKKSIH